ncbi:MAG: DUF2330 domain-containing protein [Spirulina sp. DLM2.Bin59]|nr:MAG: DUF2330 domain-containing protein [Spirulina sp. DLM2.Bin59]
MQLNGIGKKAIALLLAVFLCLGLTPSALAFCGFFVAQIDANLFNEASQVIIVRDGDRTVLTMANDYQGAAEDFALVVPVPVLLEEDQVNVGDPAVLQRLDEYSAPRLVEYFDSNPCHPPRPRAAPMPAPAMMEMDAGAVAESDRSLGVTIEAEFSVGEYDILILSAQESTGLETWLRQNNYRIPTGASAVLQPYIRQNFKFFVAKVNLEEFKAGESQNLRPLMMAYESPRFMLPIRLGMLNAQGEQDLIIYLITRNGQVELTNYRTVKIPSEFDVPEFVQDEFPDFYQAAFQKAYERERKEVGFLEYAWDMSWCDPCAANPLTPDELRKAGVFWLGETSANQRRPNPPGGGAVDAFITRLHVRYGRDRFPEDLAFQTTGNRQIFQGRYIIRRPYRGEMKCDAAADYRAQVRDRQEREANQLVSVTGWSKTDVFRKIDWFTEPSQPRPWWRNLWDRR